MGPIFWVWTTDLTYRPSSCGSSFSCHINQGWLVIMNSSFLVSVRSPRAHPIFFFKRPEIIKMIYLQKADRKSVNILKWNSTVSRKKDFCRIAVSSYPLNFCLKIETHQVFKMILSVLNLPPTFFFQHPVWKDLTALSQTGPKRSKVVELGLKRPLLAQKVQDNMDDPNLS